VKQIFAILLLFWLGAVTPCVAEATSPDLLTPAERAWLAEHPDIVLGVGDEWAPSVVKDANGRFTGFAFDHLDLLNRKLGTNIRLQAGPWHEMVEQAETGQLAGLNLSAILAQRKTHFLFSDVLHTVQYFIYLRSGQSVPDGGLNGLQGRRVGYLKGILYLRKLLEEYPTIEAVPLDNTEALAYALLRGEIDAVVDSYSLEYWRASRGVLGFAPMRLLPEKQVPLVMSVRKDWPELVGILNKGIAAISTEEMAELYRRWYGSDYLNRVTAVKIPLSAEEQAWLADHPELRLGTTGDQPPAVIVGDDGRLSGIVVDYVELLNQRLGTQIRIVLDEWTDLVARGIQRDVDMLGFAFERDAHRPHFDFTRRVFRTFYYIYARTDEPDPPRNLAALAGKRVGYIESTRIVEEIAGRRGDITLVPFADTESLVNALLSHRVDAVINNISFEYWRKRNTHTGFWVAALIPEMGGDLVIAVRKDWPELTAIINKALASISEQERMAILNRWVGSEIPLQPEQPAVSLLPAEQAWLAQHPVVRVGISPNWAPLEFIDEQGTPQGVSVAYLRRLRDLLGIHFEFINTRTWHRAKRELERGSLDVLPATAVTTARKQTMQLTKPYLALPAVIFSAADVAYLGGLDALKGKTVVIIRGDIVGDRLRADWPQIQLRRVANTQEALRQLVEDQTLVFVNNLITTSYYIGQSGLTQVKVVGETPYEYRLGMAVRQDWPILADILQKGLDAIPKHEQDSIYHDWISIKYEHNIDYSLLWQILTAVALTLFFILYWNRRLALEVEQRRLVEAALHQAKNAADQASRAKSAFLANMSHDLRTPLNSVLGFAQLLEVDENLDTEQRDRARDIRRGGERLLSLINEVLDFAKLEAGRFDTVAVEWDSDELLRELAGMFRLRAEQKGIALRVEAAAALPARLSCDVKCLHQILVNLLDNAIKATAKGHVTLRADFNDGDLMLAVADTGSGIPAERLEAIFEPFEQAGGPPQRSQGTGLGLAIARGLAERLGGTLSVQSTLAQGSTFRLQIPAQAVAQPAQAKPKIRQPDERIVGYRRCQGHGPLHVLVVDDEPGNRAILRRLLEQLGFTVQEAETGAQCLEIVQTWQPDLILMDLRMPDLDGIEATRRLRVMPALRDTPIVAVTAAAFAEDRARALAAGCNAHLAKPVLLETLLDTLVTLLPLEWRYGTAAEQDEEAPLETRKLTAQQSRRLAKLVRTGSVTAIQALAEELSAADYCPVLARRLATLAKDCDMAGLRQLAEAIETTATPNSVRQN